MELILALLMNNLAPNSVPAEQLAPAILEAANEYGVDPVVIARIIIVESRGKAKAVNKKTKDYGLMQINVNTAISMGISNTCLLDWRCNLKHGTEILSKFKRVCRYNVGTASLKGARLEKCLHYEKKLYSINYSL